MNSVELPALFGKYELQKYLGGGMSHVYRARDTVLGREVAVKILTEAGCADDEAKARFLQEARLASGFAHDNIIRVHDYGELSGRPYIVMEFLTGEDLRSAIREGRAGSLAGKLNIAAQLARALQFIHAQGIVHRDIKPDNVHLSRSGRVYLMDFGIAKSRDLALTRTGFSVGTPYYRAPEQVLGRPATEKVDIFSFGLVVYELLTGSRAFTGESVEALFFLILNQPVNVDALRQAGVPEPVVRLVLQLTAKSPDERPPDFAVVAEELERLAESARAPQDPRHSGAAPAQVASPAGRPSSRRLPVTLLLVVLLAACGIAAWFALRPGPAVNGKADGKVKELPATISLASGDMVLVPAGAYLSGESRQQAALPAFYIDRTEVSSRAYGEFCRLTGRPLPAGFSPEHPGYPVANVTIADARAFASWAGKRLPAAAEWEKAARGVDGRSYPWGNEEVPGRANVEGKSPADVDSHPEGASPCGALNMAGNVWELVEDRRTPSPEAVRLFTEDLKLEPPPRPGEPWTAIRGGAFNLKLSNAVTYDSASIPERYVAPDIGFRCAKDAP